MRDVIRVLLVDDEKSFWEKMSTSLTEIGFQVQVATSGPEALATAEECQGNFQVAVIDQVMGPPNGTETMLRIHESYPWIEAILLTGWGDMGPGERAMELGAHRYMSKPVTAEELALNIRTAARFGRERQRGLALQALVRVGQQVSSVQGEEELYQLIYDEARQLLPGLSGFLVSQYQAADGMVNFPFCQVRGERIDIPSRRRGNSITEYVLRTEQPLLLPDGDRPFRREHGLGPAHDKLGECSSEIVAPVFLQGRVVGTLSALGYEPGVHYSQEHLSVLQAFANQVAGTIQSVEQFDEARQLREAVAALAVQRAKEAVLEAIVARAHALINSDFTGLILQDEDGRLFKIQPVIPPEHINRFGEPRQDRGVTREVVTTRLPKVIPDTEQDPLVKESVRNFGIRSMLALPLIRGDRVLGVLYAHSLSPRSFTGHDVDLWTAFATYAAAILQSTLEKEREVEDARRLVEAVGALAERRDLDGTMACIAREAKALFRSDTSRLACVDPATGQIVAWKRAEDDREEFYLDGEPRPGGRTYHVLQTKEPLCLSSVGPQDEPLAMPELLAKGLRSFVSLPLLSGGRVIGVAHCDYLTRRQAFDPQLNSLVEAFSARAAAALARAWQDRVSDIWHELDRAAAVCTDLDSLYRLFADHAQRAMGADFAIFYPYDPTAPAGQLALMEEQAARAGRFQAPWQPPKGGHRGGVHKKIEGDPDGVMIVNDLRLHEGQYNSRLAEREGVRAFVGLRLDVVAPGHDQCQIAGMLFANYRQPTSFQARDLVQLRHAGSLMAESILRLSLVDQVRSLLDQRNRQLQAVVSILQAFRGPQDGRLDGLAQAAKDALEIESCTVLEYDQGQTQFTRRGTAGLERPDSPATLPPEFKAWFMDAPGPTEIPDVDRDERLRGSGFAQREKIRSVVVWPLCVEDERLGLLFASYRTAKRLTEEEKESIGLFADFAALVLYEARLRDEIRRTKKRLEKRMFLTWVSMIEATWRHPLVTQAASIRNYTAALQRRVGRRDALPPGMERIPEILDEIDTLAARIAAAPPRVPQSWEMEAEFLPLAPLLQEVAERESKPSPLRSGPPVGIAAEVGELGGVQVKGYRRWLIYALEALLENARNAMKQGGTITITGRRLGPLAEVRILDPGDGVPEAIRPRIFKELIPNEPGQPGTGLGALLAGTIVEEHDGTIELERPGPGDTTVLLRLPVAKEAEK